MAVRAWRHTRQVQESSEVLRIGGVCILSLFWLISPVRIPTIHILFLFNIDLLSLFVVQNIVGAQHKVFVWSTVPPIASSRVCCVLAVQVHPPISRGSVSVERVHNPTSPKRFLNHVSIQTPFVWDHIHSVW
jgi:hypothetical protein